jgi:prolyl oligopeptidase
MEKQMKATLVAWLVAAGIVLFTAPATAQWRYPPAPTSDAVDTWHGKVYRDPYRPLEDTNDKTVAAWFKAQAVITDNALARIPGRDALVREWLAMDKRTPPRYRDIHVESERVFYRKTLGGGNIGKIYFRERWDGVEHLLFDPATYKKSSDTAVKAFMPSFDGKYVLLGLAAKGGEWSELRVLKVESRELLADAIYPALWFGLSWLPDSTAFLYNGSSVTDIKSPDIELNRQLRVHRLGSPVSDDRDILSGASTPDLGIYPKEFPLGNVPESAPDRLIGRLGTVQSEMRLYTAPVAELGKPRITWQSLAQRSDNLVRSLAVDGNWLYAATHSGAPHYRVVRSLIDKPDWKNAETVIPEAADSIETIAESKDFLFVAYSDGIRGRVIQYHLATGRVQPVALPLAGAIELSCPDAHSNRCLVTVSSWLRPPTVFEVDGDSGSVTKSKFSGDAEYPELADLVSEEIEIPGHDGTPIPLSIIRRTDMKLDGSNPCILEGYGAYSISYTPYFDPKFSVAAHGVVVAFVHVRGGGEKGEAWYRAGYKTTKPNTWKDFISAAEYLIAKGYTSAQHLSGRGTSAGGILISRAITERPDLFAAAVVNVGVANAMRAEFSPNGPVNTPEFGTVKDPVEAQALYEMDGLQHVQPGVHYPGVLGVAGWNDPRVAVWEPGKFVAAVQQASTSGRPALLLVNYDNGHFTEEKSVTFRNFANQYAFALWQTGHQGFQPRKARQGGNAAGSSPEQRASRN